MAAARLSPDDGCRVLLLEAGPDYPAAAGLPADVAPEEIASAISCLAGEGASSVHGAVLDVDGGRNAA